MAANDSPDRGGSIQAAGASVAIICLAALAGTIAEAGTAAGAGSPRCGMGPALGVVGALMGIVAGIAIMLVGVLVSPPTRRREG